MKIRSTFGFGCGLLVLSCSAFMFPALCQAQKVTGYIKGIKKTPVVFNYVKDGETVRDTVIATNDRFTYTARKSENERVAIYISGGRFFHFWNEPGDVMLSGSAEKPYALSMKGGKDNTAENEHNTQISWPLLDNLKGKSDSATAALLEENRKADLDFIIRHPDARTSALVLAQQAVTYDQHLALYDQLFQKLTPEVQGSAGGKEAKKRIESLRSQPTVGKPVANFTLPDTLGKQVSLDSYKGKYVLLDFWGHWCGPCIKAFPKLVDIHQRYQNKLTIIGVAAEHSDDTDKWQKAIQAGGSKWVQVSELAGDKGEVNERFNIVAFPTYFLLDKDGVLLKKANSIAEMEDALRLLLD